MKSNNLLNNKKEILNQDKTKNKFVNIKSDYFLRKIFNNTHKNISLNIVKYNKNIQKKRLNINNHKKYI